MGCRNEMKRNETKWNETKRNETNWNETKWNEMKWNETKRNEMKRNETKWNEMKWNETKRNETKWNEMKRNETKRNETKWNEMKRNEMKSYYIPVNLIYSLLLVYKKYYIVLVSYSIIFLCYDHKSHNVITSHIEGRKSQNENTWKFAKARQHIANDHATIPI